jgi:hypothetical protein
MAGTKRRGSSHPGIEVRHSARCARSSGAGRCTCSPSTGQVHSRREKRWLKRSFDTLAEAKAWRAEADVALRRGATATPTVAELAEAWVAGARSGAIRNRSGRRLQAAHGAQLRGGIAAAGAAGAGRGPPVGADVG